MPSVAMDVSPVPSIASGPSDFTRSMEKYFIDTFDIPKASGKYFIDASDIPKPRKVVRKRETTSEYDRSLDRLEFISDGSRVTTRKYSEEPSSGDIQHNEKSSSGGVQNIFTPRREPTAIAKLRALVATKQHLLPKPSEPSEPTPEQTFGSSDSRDSSFATKDTVIHRNKRSTPDYVHHVPEPTMLPFTQSIWDSVEDMQAQIASHKVELATLKEENKDLKKENKDLKKENRDLKSQNLGLIVEVERSQEQLKSARNEAQAHLRNARNESREQLKSATNENKELRCELEDLRKRFAKLQKERDRMGEALMYEWGKKEVGLVRKADGSTGMGYRYKYGNSDRQSGDITILD